MRIETTMKQECVEKGELPTDLAIAYLNLYLGKTDWPVHIRSLLNWAARRRYTNIKRALCCAILLPAGDRSVRVDPEHPENNLVKVLAYAQLEQKDWFELFRKVVKQDLDIDQWRKQVYALGIIEPIEYAPMARQAYNWLYYRAEASKELSPETAESFKRLVQVYGGAVVCNIFTRHEEALKKVVNWRSGYFFERLIFEVYSIDQVVKIKKAELAKTNKDLVRGLIKI